MSNHSIWYFVQVAAFVPAVWGVVVLCVYWIVLFTYAYYATGLNLYWHS